MDAIFSRDVNPPKTYRTSRYLQFSHQRRGGGLFVPHEGVEVSVSPRLMDILRYHTTPAKRGDYLNHKRMDPAEYRRIFDFCLSKRLLLEHTIDQDRIYRLEYLQIDVNTACNHRCVYCPVSLRPKRSDVMPMNRYVEILDKLRPIYATLKWISFSSYNEPTLDPYFLERVKILRERGLRFLLLTNGSGLIPPVLDELRRVGVFEIQVNLPTLDEREYRRLHGTRDLKRIVRNLEYAVKTKMPFFIQVQGLGDGDHRRNFTMVRKRFERTSAAVFMAFSKDRAGYLPAKWNLHVRKQSLHGCDCNGSRPINWLHINARGDCFLCCQDYEEKHVIGNIRENALEDILRGEAAARYRRWIYGIEESPDDFMCRRCVFAVDKAPLGGTD